MRVPPLVFIGLLACAPAPPGQRFEIVEPVLAIERPGVQLEVGFDNEGERCAHAGNAVAGQGVCGEEGLSVVAYQTDRGLAVAGYLLGPVAEVTAVLDDLRRHTFTLIPFPDGTAFAFGALIEDQPDWIAIEVVGEEGEIIANHSPSIGP